MYKHCGLLISLEFLEYGLYHNTIFPPSLKYLDPKITIDTIKRLCQKHHMYPYPEIKMDVKIYKKFLILIWKQEKDLKSIEENTQGTAFRKLQ
jgi:hypothetical protein